MTTIEGISCCRLRYLFVARYNCLLRLHGFYLKGLLFVGIILRIIGELKDFPEKYHFLFIMQCQ